MENNSNFIRTIIKEDLESGKRKEVITRFPPEPNGYLHIGHAKSIVINFGLADDFNGKTNLRFDDTNPLKEDQEFVDAIKEDVKWLGYEWEELHFASNYFEEMYNRAVLLIKKGKAYVDDLSQEEIRQYRGTLTEPGKESPYRSRSVEENLDLFERMRGGEFENGAKVLRAKIDMSSPNLNLRDPVIYRVSHTTHHNTGDTWCIYPMYAFAHPLEDAIEGVTHSLCTTEFEDQRPLYNWVVAECEMESTPQQIEFGRLNISNTVMSKRKLKQLVEENYVDGWDDPRMPTISGLRRKGYTPEAIREFVKETGVSKGSGVVDEAMLEHYVREDLKLKAPRTMGVLRPLKVVITNYPEDQTEMLDAEINPENPEMGIRQIPFSREIFVEQDDFMEDPPKKYFRLFPGNEVRLKHAYFIKCNEVIKDEDGNVVELHCTYDPETKSGTGFTGRKVKGTLHWVDAKSAIPAEFRLYEPLILDEDADQNAETDTDDAAESDAEGKTFLDYVNPNSLEIVNGFIEPNMKDVKAQDKFQFFRHGYFNVDPKHTTAEKPVFNRIVSLKSSFKLK
ncbi:glutamine--tRNA ligase/YqeY domain fusion protein [Cytobacillus oceanisediminis]|uniref:glutamine--tRNA ligase/YqeY domain fusion protein n=1 Tax=Cytobacillus TaxID=2675230 RepID=UPI00203D438D|nr:glutamine--tRNA ligase/YqeY domain fusion protein [Cytobacillus oceanisediminis]MCS0827178.1 glutamine--tRNA ligase/YqeY domain fusion protein [Cytobacillus firmus]MCM3245494.1 glutamine--tRNA ligase/YqeY domain fusion protein [Cytobacillus oceanisediminis]MCM3403390.1 glutamine--tRNA ligase/YqeY domain fusion protein [Cytobacillus oceanisediminis]MDK7667099.1 glutamine--tRNA ligase/YqeY domain fusion protein [Cytobacillus oceanisediminis]USK44760.1 glutamine--tRNA ligase/YqeY domain fusion